MTEFRSNGQTVKIGIDIGWSEKKKTCAFAVDGVEVIGGGRDWTVYSNSDRQIAVGLFRYKELLSVTADLIKSLGRSLDRTAIVIDGPIGATGLATTNRMVNSEFCRRPFNGRMQPSPVATGIGPQYAKVTDDLLRVLYAAANRPYCPAWWNGQPMSGLTCCETHPTVGLGLLLPMQDAGSLPSRSAPRRMAKDGKDEDAPYIRAKSDWYWQLGANRFVAQILGCPCIADEVHHERVAALYCLAVASRLAAFASGVPTVAAIGNGEGVYVIPTAIDRSWHDAVLRIGVHAGALASQDHLPFLAQPIPIDTANREDEQPPLDEADESEKGDAATLVLMDNGGIWERHNGWLAGLPSPVCFKTDDKHQEVVRLEQALGSGQWMPSDPQQSPYQMAKKRGFARAHLSKVNAWAVPILLADCDCAGASPT